MEEDIKKIKEENIRLKMMSEIYKNQIKDYKFELHEVKKSFQEIIKWLELTPEKLIESNDIVKIIRSNYEKSEKAIRTL